MFIYLFFETIDWKSFDLMFTKKTKVYLGGVLKMEECDWR